MAHWRRGSLLGIFHPPHGWWQDYQSGACNLEDYQEQGHRLRQKLDHQLRDCRLKNADHQRLIDDIGRQHDHGRMVLFLEHP